LLILFVELLLETISLAVIAAVLGVVMRDSGGVVRGLLATVLVYAAVVLGAGAFAVSLSRKSASGPPPGWVRSLGINAGIWRRVQRSLRQLRGSVSSLREAHVGLMLVALAFSILHILARLVTLPIIVYSYGGDVASAPLILWPLVLLYGAAVSPAPGGGGVVELVFKAALGGTLLHDYSASSLIWWRVYTFYIYIVIGAIAAGAP
jgi:uncharacterized protein (TIRG00374 family)